MTKILSIRNASADLPTFKDVKQWHDSHMHPNILDLDDQTVYENVYHSGKWAGIFQCTSKGAQQLFVNAKPRSIIDIAALTSIYRPGPLAANVDKLWLEHEKVPYDWGHPLINDTLKETRGLLVFQEAVMALAHKVSGFPMAETDEVRRAIMKRSISGGDAAKEKVKKLEISIIDGAVKNGVPPIIAKKMYDTICFMSGYGFNRSHAVAYAIDSYWCAWLMTHYESLWLTAYVESMLGNPIKKAKAFGEIKQLGYNIVPIDINEATCNWTVLSGKRFMPSLLSCKGLGDTAAEEIMASRPYTSIEDVLWNSDGSWRPSKFNKRALEVLIKLGAFESLDCVGEGKLFDNYHHMHEVIIENNNSIRKSTKKDPHLGRKIFYELARALRPMPAWTRREQAQHTIDALGSLDVIALIDPDVFLKFSEKGINSIDELEHGDTDIVWFVTTVPVIKTTKTGKTYVSTPIVGLSGKTYRLSIWGAKTFPEYALCFAEVKSDDYGCSTTAWKIKEVK